MPESTAEHLRKLYWMVTTQNNVEDLSAVDLTKIVNEIIAGKVRPKLETKSDIESFGAALNNLVNDLNKNVETIGSEDPGYYNKFVNTLNNMNRYHSKMLDAYNKKVLDYKSALNQVQNSVASYFFLATIGLLFGLLGLFILEFHDKPIDKFMNGIKRAYDTSIKDIQQSKSTITSIVQTLLAPFKFILNSLGNVLSDFGIVVPLLTISACLMVYSVYKITQTHENVKNLPKPT